MEKDAMINLLLVEDDPAVMHVFSKILTLEGLNVTAVKSGKQALDKLAKLHHFDVAIIDRVLPGEVQGHDLAVALRKAQHKIGIVEISGYPGDIGKPDSASLHDLALAKPIGRQELLDAVRIALQAGSLKQQEPQSDTNAMSN